MQTSIDPKTLESRLCERMAFAPSPTRLPDSPDLPLAFNVPMPDVLGFRNGHVHIRFEDFAMTGLEHLKVSKSAVANPGAPLRLEIEWPEISIEGRYVLGAESTPEMDLDTAGTLLDFEHEDIQCGGTRGGGLTPLTQEESDAMMDNARAQRQRLMDTTNGQQLMRQFNEHNETYNTAFTTSPALRNGWAAQGATKEMALHTHGAVRSDGDATTTVNSKGATYGPNEVSYNSNAFTQQLNVAVATAMADPDWSPFSAAMPPEDSPYVQAALAALTFGKSVGENTDNDKSKVTEMDQKGIMASVESGTEPEPVSANELGNVMAQGIQDGGEAADEASSRNWIVLDEDDRRLVRRHIQDAADRHLQSADKTIETLWSGASKARIRGARANVLLHKDGDRVHAMHIEVELPAFEFELDDSSWRGTAGELARERLGQISFVRSLMHGQIRSGLEGALRNIWPIPCTPADDS